MAIFELICGIIIDSMNDNGCSWCCDKENIAFCYVTGIVNLWIKIVVLLETFSCCLLFKHRLSVYELNCYDAAGICQCSEGKHRWPEEEGKD